ncbi:NAD synthetase [Acidobacteria bacterium Mor1]|nr:NAD synthetase [Acidobacteria bacterium Mor1]
MTRYPIHKGEHNPTPGLKVDPEWSVRMLTDFIAREVRRTGHHKVVLGLSGGLDSALSAFLGAKALGPESVHAVLMPYRSSSADSLADAQKVVDALGIHAETVEISSMVDGFVGVTSGEIDRNRLGNVMSRCRMTVLFDRSAAHRALVLGTSNKTELLLGYGTLNGDLASAINPLGDLYKAQVRQLSAHLGVPRSILDKPPSADLWPDQSDEKELGFSYDEVDRLLALLIDARISRASALERGFSPEMIDRVTKLVLRSQFKRRLPVIAKMSTRSINWDFRYPRDWKS